MRLGAKLGDFVEWAELTLVKKGLFSVRRGSRYIKVPETRLQITKSPTLVKRERQMFCYLPTFFQYIFDPVFDFVKPEVVVGSIWSKLVNSNF